MEWQKEEQLTVEGQTLTFLPNSVWRPKSAEQTDEDYEDIARILDRLQLSQTSLLPRISLACTCMLHPPTHRHPRTGAREELHSVSSTDSDSSNECGDDSFQLAHVMRAFALYEKKPLHRRGASLGALRNLIHSYIPRDDIGDDDTIQLLEQLDGQDFGLREMSLLTMKQLCVRESNAFKFLLHDAFPRLVLFLELETMCGHHESAAFVLEQLVSHPALTEWWDEVMKQGGFTSVVNHAQAGQPLPVRYACACVLRALAQYQFYAALIIHNAMTLVTTFKTMNSDFQEVYTEILSKLMLHADDQTVSLLNADALPSSLDMLKQGPCGIQQQALMLITSLTDSSSGLAAILQDPSTVPMLLSAMINTECRKTRQNAALAVQKLTSCRDVTSQKQFLLHVDKFHHETEDKIEAAGAETEGMAMCQMSKSERMDRAIGDLGKDLVRLVHKLGKMEQDLLGHITDIHLAPCIDTDVCDLTTLCHVLQVLSNLLHFSTNQIQLPLFEQEYATQVKLIKSIKRSLEVNYKICQILIQQRLLCIVDLLSVYTQKLLDIISICSKPLKSMNGMSKSQLLFQAWGSQSETMSSAGKINVASLFDSNEVEVIVKILEVLDVLCFSSTQLGSDSASLEAKINETLSHHSRTKSAPINPNSRSKKSKKKHFHSKISCELCQKSSKISGKSAVVQKSTNSKETVDKILVQTPVQSQCECDYRLLDEHDSSDVLEEKFRVAFRMHMSKQQRETRVALYEAGVVESVGPWLLSSDSRHQTLVLSILRHMVQPVQEQISPTPPKQPKVNQVVRTRPAAMSMTAKERDQALDIALYQMSSRMKQFIEEALGRRSNQPPNSPREPSSTPNSASQLNDVKTRHAENAWRKVNIKILQTDQAKSTSNLTDLSDATYRQEDYDRFARSSSSLNLKSSRPSSALKRPDSSMSLASASSSKTGTSLRSHSFTRLSNAKGRTRRQSVSPKRTRRPSSAVPSTKPVNGYQVMVKTAETKIISISQSIEKLSSSSSDSMGESNEVNPANFPSTVYDLDRPRSRLGTSVSDEGHQCESEARPRSSSSRGRTRSRQSSLVSDTGNGPIGQRYPKRVWVPWKPQLQPTQSVGEQCRCLVAMVIGKVLLQQMFAKDQQLRKNVLDFMDQYIKHGQVSSHMKLSEQGVMPRMVDFLRINEDDVMLEMMGLSVVQQLLKSDRRLVEVFEKHGGTDLLVAMSSDSRGPLRQHVTSTLHAVTKAEDLPNRRVMSAPVKRNRQPDIWDQIMQRWKQEDKVVESVLKKFNP